MINGVSAIDSGQSGTITFIASNKYKKFLDTTKASAIISNDKNLIAKKNGIIVDNPKLAIIKVLDYFSLNDTDETGIHDSAQINPNAIIGKNLSLIHI